MPNAWLTTGTRVNVVEVTKAYIWFVVAVNIMDGLRTSATTCCNVGDREILVDKLAKNDSRALSVGERDNVMGTVVLWPKVSIDVNEVDGLIIKLNT